MALFRDLDLPNPELMRNRAFVAGNWVEAKSADRITVTDPFDGRDIADVPSFAVDTVRHAIDSAEGVIASKFRNAAQTCVCAESLCVQEAILPVFSRALSKRVAHLKLGNGSDPETTQGPLIDQKAVAKIEEPIEDAVSRGATVIAGRRRSKTGGSFFEPTVMTGGTQEMKMAREDTFAPLAGLIPSRTQDEVIALADNTDCGLASYFLTRNYGRIWRAAEALEADMVGVNTGLFGGEAAPLGWVDQSGPGREGPKYGINEYREIKYVCVAGTGAAA